MYFAMLYIMFLLGIIIASICGLMPGPIQLVIPFYFRFLAFMIGALMGFIGIVMIWIKKNRSNSFYKPWPSRFD